MIIIQDLDKNIIGVFTTISGFLRSPDMRGARIGSYDYVRKRLASVNPLTAIKYKSFYITKSKGDMKRKKDGIEDVFVF